MQTSKMKYLLILTLFFTLPLFAVVVPHLYDATLIAPTRSEAERQDLLKQGLLQVLEKISGDTQLQRKSVINDALQHAADFVEQYTYQGQRITIRYSPDLINHLLEQAGGTIWGSKRPSVLLWLGIEQNLQRRLVGVDTDLDLQAQLQSIASAKGLPLFLPLMDLEDVGLITVTDVWHADLLTVQRASERYNPQVILLGQIIAPLSEKHGWQGSWQLLHANQNASWQAQTPTLEALLQQSIQETIRHLLGRYETKKPLIEGASIVLGIQNVHSVEDFRELETYLSSLEQISEINVLQLKDHHVILKVTAHTQEGLKQTLKRDRHLLVEQKEDFTEPVELAYSWVP